MPHFKPTREHRRQWMCPLCRKSINAQKVTKHLRKFHPQESAKGL